MIIQLISKINDVPFLSVLYAFISKFCRYINNYQLCAPIAQKYEIYLSQEEHGYQPRAIECHGTSIGG